MAEGLPTLPDFVAGERAAHERSLEALAEAGSRGVDGISEFEERLGDPSLAPDVVVIALLLSRCCSRTARYRRGVGSSPSSRACGPSSPGSRSSASSARSPSTGWRATRNAEQILLARKAEQGPSPETNGILGRVYMDRFLTAHAAGDADTSERWLIQAIDTYVEGHDADPTDPYPGINALSLMEFTFSKPPRRDALLARRAP